MKTFSSPKIIERRRSIVADLAARGGTNKDIAARLSKLGETNPETGDAWDTATVSRDIKVLKEKAIQTRKEELLSELIAAKDSAWKCGNHVAVVEAIKAEILLASK